MLDYEPNLSRVRRPTPWRWVAVALFAAAVCCELVPGQRWWRWSWVGPPAPRTSSDWFFLNYGFYPTYVPSSWFCVRRSPVLAAGATAAWALARRADRARPRAS